MKNQGVGIFALALTLALGGCGDDTGGEEGEDLPDCALDAALSGGATAELGMNDVAWGCAAPFGADTGVTMIFLPGLDDVGQIEIAIADVAEGEIGTFPATNRFTSPDGNATWSTAAGACEVTIESGDKSGEDEQSNQYQLVGRGSCSAPADPVGENPGQPIQLGDFEFRFVAYWFK